MEKVQTLEYNKDDSESTRQEKNKILVDREVLCLFSLWKSPLDFLSFSRGIPYVLLSQN